MEDAPSPRRAPGNSLGTGRRRWGATAHPLPPGATALVAPPKIQA